MKGVGKDNFRCLKVVFEGTKCNKTVHWQVSHGSIDKRPRLKDFNVMRLYEIRRKDFFSMDRLGVLERQCSCKSKFYCLSLESKIREIRWSSW